MLALGVIALLLAACGGGSSQSTGPAADPGSSGSALAEPAADKAFPVTIEHKFGATEITGEPQRVVSVGFTDQDYLLGLGVTPVGIREWFGEKPFATWPWAEDELGDAEPEVLTRELNYEQIAALRPDLLIGLYSGMTEEEYRLLSEIAPTVAPSPDFPEYAIPWQEQTRLTGQALGRDEQAEDLVAEVEAQIEAARGMHPEFEGATAVIGSALGGEYYVYGADTASGQLLVSLGMELPPEIDELTDNENQYFIFTAERLDLVKDLDVLLWLEGADDAGPAQLLADPIYQGLDVVAEGRDLFLGYDLYGGALSFSSVLSLPLLVDELVPQMVAAIDGDPAAEAAVGT